MATKTPVTEMCVIHLREPFVLLDRSTDEGAIWHSSVETLKKLPGFRDIYTSSIVEDHKKARMFLNWDCVEDHFAFYQLPHFPEFRDKLVSLCERPPFPTHTVFEPSRPKSLEAPATEVFMVYFPTSVTDEEKTAFNGKWKDFVAKVEPAGREKGLLSADGGWVNEEMEPEGVDGVEGSTKAFMGLFGWESVDKSNAASRTAEFRSVVGSPVAAMLGSERYHVELS